MITEKEYLKAIELIKAYREQVCNHVSEIIDIENDPSKLLKKGQKIRLLKVHRNSTSNVGDIVTVEDSYYHNLRSTKHPIVCFINKNNYMSRISKKRGYWDYEVL